MRHCHRPALLDLFLEQRHHAAVRIQHIAEPHRDEARVRPRIHVLAIHFGDPLGGAHDVRGIDRLVGGNQHEGPDTVPLGRFGQPHGAQHVVANRLANLGLQDRQVLVGRGMEDHVRLVLADYLLDGRRVTDVTQDGIEDQVPKIAPQLEVDAVQRVFTVVDHDQFYRVQAGNLTAQLGTDGAAAAGDHHALAGQSFTNGLPVQRNRLPAQEVIDRHPLEHADPRRAVAEILQGRQGAELDFALLADFHDALHLLVVGRGHRDDHQFDLEFGTDGGQAVDAAKHRNAVHVGTPQALVIVQEADDVEAAAMPQFLLEQGAGAASTEDEHALQAFLLARGGYMGILPEPVHHARQAQ